MDYVLHHFLNHRRCSILAVFKPMDLHMMMRRGDHRFHDMFLHRAAAAGSVISSPLLHNGDLFGSRDAVSPEASRLYALLQRRQQPSSTQTFALMNYSSSLIDMMYLINHQIEMKNTVPCMRTALNLDIVQLRSCREP